MLSRTIIYMIFRGICLLLIGTLFCLPAMAQRNGKHTQLPEHLILSLAKSRYDTFLATHLVMDTVGNGDFLLVQNVWKKLVEATGKLKSLSKSRTTAIQNFQWEVNLVGRKEANAWCLPGGKMAVYTGLLPLTQSRASLAIYLSHEIAHVLLQQGNERMARYLDEKFGGMSLQEAMEKRPLDCIEYIKLAYGMETNAGFWDPFNPFQENEADFLGLSLAKLAGFHPREALVFWERMGELSPGPLQPELMSMHPLYPERMKEMRKTIEKWEMTGF